VAPSVFWTRFKELLLPAGRFYPVEHFNAYSGLIDGIAGLLEVAASCSFTVMEKLINWKPKRKKKIDRLLSEPSGSFTKATAVGPNRYGRNPKICGNLKIQLRNHDCADDEEKMAKMRLLTELVMLAMEDVELQTKCLQAEQGENISVHLEALNDAMNKAYYYRNQLDAWGVTALTVG
jgi:hypothetical protein